MTPERRIEYRRESDRAIARVEASLDEIRALLTSGDKRMKDMEALIDEVYDAICGDLHSEGLLTKVTSLERWRNRVDNRGWELVKGIIIPLLAAVGGVIAGALGLRGGS